MPSDLGVALIGLSGTAVGAAAAFIGSERAGNRQLRAERERAEAEISADAMHASLALQGDLRETRWRYDIAAKEDKYWHKEFALPWESWRTHRDAMTRAVSPDEWRQLDDAFLSLKRSELRARVRREDTGTDQPPLTNVEKQKLRPETLPNIDAALKILAKICGEPKRLRRSSEAENTPVAGPQTSQ